MISNIRNSPINRLTLASALRNQIMQQEAIIFDMQDKDLLAKMTARDAEISAYQNVLHMLETLPEERGPERNVWHASK